MPQSHSYQVTELRFKVQSVGHFTLTRLVGILSEIFYVRASRYFVCEERGTLFLKTRVLNIQTQVLVLPKEVKTDGLL